MAVYTANDTRDQALTGGSEADTFYTGHNSVIVTSGGGGDTIVYQHLPWNNSGHVRDFVIGTDKLDFSALFSASGYTGSDPVADGYLRFASDGAGGTQLFYDPDAAGTAYPWPFLVTTLDHINPTGLTWAQLSNAAPPPPPPERERVATTDGGYVEVWHEPSGNALTFHLQKYNAAGTAVGSEHTGPTKAEVQIVALSDGGYAVASFQNFIGATYVSIGVYDAASAFEGGTQSSEPALFVNQGGFDIAASPHGGFIIGTSSASSATASMGTSDHVIMFDNSGAEVERARLAGSAPQIDVLADGTYRVSWTDDGAARTLNIDPRNPPDLSSPAQPSFTAIDNVAPGGGGGIPDSIDLSSGVGWTNDATPTLRFTVTEPGELDLVFNTNFPGPLVAPDRTIVITTNDVANGYIDVPFTLPSGESTYFAQVRITDVNGVVTEVQHFALNIDTVTPPAPGITTVTDDAGSRTGTVPNGGSTDDTTPTVQIAYTSSGTQFDNDRIQLYVDGSPVGAPVTANADDAARGLSSSPRRCSRRDSIRCRQS